MEKYYINQYIKNIAKKNSEEKNQNEQLLKNIADSFIDVGEVRGNQINEISDELGNKIVEKGLLLKSGGSYFPRTSDYFINKQEIANVVLDFQDEEIEGMKIMCCFGRVIWDPGNTSVIDTMTIIIVISYYTSTTTNKYGLIYYEM